MNIAYRARAAPAPTIATVLHEAHERQAEAADALEEGPKGFYRSGGNG